MIRGHAGRPHGGPRGHRVAWKHNETGNVPPVRVGKQFRSRTAARFDNPHFRPKRQRQAVFEGSDSPSVDPQDTHIGRLDSRRDKIEPVHQRLVRGEIVPLRIDQFVVPAVHLHMLRQGPGEIPDDVDVYSPAVGQPLREAAYDPRDPRRRPAGNDRPGKTVECPFQQTLVPLHLVLEIRVGASGDDHDRV